MRRLPGKSGRHRELLKACEEQLGSDSIVYTGTGHWKITLPNGRKVVISSTPSSPRSFLNERAILRRHGIKV